MNKEALLREALSARERAYAPYSNFYVGAAILDEHGALHLGCNVENAAYPQGSCAEATAIGAMVTGGGTRIARIAVVGGRQEPRPCSPCGGCRQRILEFADEATEIILQDESGNPVVCGIADLLPATTPI